MDDARPAWADDDWLALLLGADRVARATIATFDAAAWGAPPMKDAPPADDLVHALLGLDELARRIAALVDRCADVPEPPPPAPAEPSGGLLR